jgi:hypothetical protein
MKRIIAITTSILVVIFFSTVSAHADRKTVEGFMLGTGVAILGAAIYNGIHRDSPVPQYTKNYSRHDGYRSTGYRYKHHRKYRSQGPRGHWELERIWIAPVYEKKWNPGHYNPRGEWISSRYEKFLVQNGFWQEEKIWVQY